MCVQLVLLAIHELSAPSPLDRASNRYPYDRRGNPAERVDGAGKCFRQKPFGGCDLLSVNDKILTIA
jgi:hypothetical protein